MKDSEIKFIEVDESMMVPGSKRFGNYVIDFIGQYLLVMLLAFIAGLASDLFEMDGLVIWLSDENPLKQYLIGIVISFVYYSFFEAAFQRTPGKFITGTKVVMEDGSKPQLGTIVLRCLCRFIPFEHFTFFSDHSRGLHDRLPNTYVVDVKAYQHALDLKKSFDEIGKNDY